MEEPLDVLVIGGGLTGLMVTRALRQSGDRRILIIEQQDEILRGASGMNTGKIRHYHPDPEMRAAFRRSIHQMKSFQKGKKGFFEEKPSLWLFGPSDRLQREDDKEEVVRWDRIPSGEAPDIFSLNRSAGELWVTFPEDGLVDVSALGEIIAGGFVNRGPVIQTGTGIQNGERTSEGWQIQLTGDREVMTDQIVIAAGAESNEVARTLDLVEQDLTPLRRHLFYVREDILPDEYGFFWDRVNDHYFREVEGGTVISYCDDFPEDQGDKNALDDPEMQLNSIVAGCYSYMRDLTLDQYWAGTFARTPDQKPIVKRDPDVPSAIWATGFNDFGVTYSFELFERIKSLTGE